MSRSVRSLVCLSFLLLLGAAGCGGGSPAKDSGGDAKPDGGPGDTNKDTNAGDTNSGDTTADTTPPDTNSSETPADTNAGNDATEAGTDTTTGTDASEAGTDSTTGGDANDGGVDAPGDTAGDVPITDDGGMDTPADMAPGTDGGDAPIDTGTDVGDASTEEGPPPVLTLTVDATLNKLVLDACSVTPATFANVAAGTHTLQLTASTLSKGGVSGMSGSSIDNYVVVNVPFPPGDPMQSRRFFMLNGIGAMANITLPATSTIGVMFLDGDDDFNEGQGMVALDPPNGPTATVDAIANVLRYNEGCSATPATIVIPDGLHRATLTASTLSAGTGSSDDFVLLRIPSELLQEDHRWVMLNGIGASYDFTPYNAQTLRAFFITSTAGATGTATVTITVP
jgi:hypothetical protein